MDNNFNFLKRSSGEMIAGVLLIVFIVAIGVIYQLFAKDYLVNLTKGADQSTAFHGYTLEQCAKFQPSLIHMAIRSNITYQDLLKVSSAPGQEQTTYNGDSIAKIGRAVLTGWNYDNQSWFSIYDHNGLQIKPATNLGKNSTLVTVGRLGNDFVVVDQIFNGTNFELNVTIIDISGNVLRWKRITFDENNQRVPDVASNNTHLIIVHAEGRNKTIDIELDVLDTNLNILSTYDVTNDDPLQYNPAVEYFNGKFYVAYETYAYGNSTIQIASFDGNSVVFIGNVTTDAYMPALSSSSDYLLVAFEKIVPSGINEIRYVVYDASLTEVVSETVAYSSSYSQELPSSTYGNGKFTIVWKEGSSADSITRGIRITDLGFTIADVFSIVDPSDTYSTDVTFDDGVFAVLTAGIQSSLWDLFLRFISDKRFYVLLQNPSELNVTITDFRIFFNDGSMCILKGSKYIEGKSTERYVAYDCDITKQCEDIKTIRLGSECGVREFTPEC